MGRALTSPCDIIQMGHISHPKHVLDVLNRPCVFASEGVVNVADHGLDVRRAVFRHVLTDGLEVLPEIARYGTLYISDGQNTSRNVQDGFNDCRRGITGKENPRFTAGFRLEIVRRKPGRN